MKFRLKQPYDFHPVGSVIEIPAGIASVLELKGVGTCEPSHIGHVIDEPWKQRDIQERTEGVVPDGAPKPSAKKATPKPSAK